MRTLFHKRTSVLVLSGAVLGLAGLLSVGNVALADFSSLLLPNADGYSLQWSLSSGTSTHYTLVDESACNGTTDYVQTTTVGQRDAYTVSLAGVPDGSTLTAVEIKPCASRVNSGGTNPVMNVFYRLSGVNSADSGAYALTGTTPSDLATTSISVGSSTVKMASTTLQVGAVLTSGGKGARLSRIVTRVTYTPLSAPTSLSAVASVSSSTLVNLSWTDASTDETGFKVERGLSTSSFSQIATVSTSTYADNTASAGTTYYYRVRATNTGGNSSYSNTASATTIAGPSVPTAPTGLSGTQNASLIQIDLSWTDASTDETGFVVERKLSANPTYSAIATTTANVVTYADTGVTQGSTYNYRVRAYNASGYSTYSNVATATAPSVPGAPTMTAYSSTSTPNDVQLSFSASGATSYSIERSFTSTSSFAFLASTTSTFYTDVAPGSGTWWYRATALNNYGTSAYGTADFETLP